MGARLTDSELYGHLWGTPELREVFEERARLASWIDILATLAEVQAELGIVPEEAAAAIRRHASVDRLDLAAVAEETRRTGHSTLGLIRGLREGLPPEGAEWVYYGITVQDLTDTWASLALRRTGEVVWRDLFAIEGSLVELAERGRDLPMAGRTHGQAGAPITLGFKAAGWADEVRRGLDRLREGASRWLVGQLGGAVGTQGFFGEAAPQLRRRFCERLGLADPGISWTASRDRIAEAGATLASIAATLARIGNEVYQLQRGEIGELREPAGKAVVGSITMPHKRNPEASEHLVTLARLVRGAAGTLLEGQVQEHERDGRGWKAEWAALPEVCLLTGTAAALARDMVERLEVDEEAMARNLGPHASSEAVLAALAPRLGKHRAQELLQEALAEGATLEEALRGHPELRDALDDEALAAARGAATGSAGAQVGEVLARIRRARDGERWP
ncbi:MAG TPA: adenylosuccinate lyase family protein [Actinomycetota bacterium]